MSVYQRVVDVSQFGGDHLEAEPFQVAFFFAALRSMSGGGTL